jgi:two-component system KDP operon response regulator KdpE
MTVAFEPGHIAPWGGRMSAALRRILIVDDEPDIVEMLRTYFSDRGYDVLTAHQGADAVMIADFQRPDAMLLDILMPDMDGVKVLRAIRAMDSNIPVVMVSGNTDEKIARDTLIMGAFDYVAKPFDFDMLERVLEAAIVAGTDADCAGTRSAWSAFGVHGAAGARKRSMTTAPLTPLVRRDRAVTFGRASASAG